MKSLQQRGLKVFFPIVLLLVVLFVPSANCWAHAFLLGSSPKDQQVLEHSPSQIWLRFSEPLQKGLFQVRLIDAQGREIEIQPRLDPKDATRIVFAISPLPKGSYTVAWNVVSEDGHPVGGAISFSVGHASSSIIASSPSKRIPIMEWFSIAWHFVSETALLLVGGLNWVAWWFSRDRLPALSALVQSQWLRSEVLFFVVLIDGIYYLLTLPSLQWGSAETWIALADSHYIQMIMVQLFLLMLAVLPNMVEGWYRAIWLFLILSFAIGGHVWDTSNFWTAWLLRQFHVVSIALWLGMLFYLVLLYRWRKKGNFPLDEKALLANVFCLALTAATVLLISGFLMGSVQSGWQTIIHVVSTWTTLLWGKIILFIFMLLIAFVETIIWRVRKTYNRILLQLELLVGVLVLFLGVWLSHSAFPSPVQHYDQVLMNQQQKIRVEIARLQIGQQPMAVYLPLNSPPPERVTVQLSVPDRQVKLPPISLKKMKSHQFAGTVSFRFPGNWQIRIEAEYPDGTYHEWKDNVQIYGGDGL